MIVASSCVLADQWLTLSIAEVKYLVFNLIHVNGHVTSDGLSVMCHIRASVPEGLGSLRQSHLAQELDLSGDPAEIAHQNGNIAFDSHISRGTGSENALAAGRGDGLSHIAPRGRTGPKRKIVAFQGAGIGGDAVNAPIDHLD